MASQISEYFYLPLSFQQYKIRKLSEK